MSASLQLSPGGGGCSQHRPLLPDSQAPARQRHPHRLRLLQRRQTAQGRRLLGRAAAACSVLQSPRHPVRRCWWPQHQNHPLDLIPPSSPAQQPRLTRTSCSPAPHRASVVTARQAPTGSRAHPRHPPQQLPAQRVKAAPLCPLKTHWLHARVVWLRAGLPEAPRPLCCISQNCTTMWLASRCAHPLLSGQTCCSGAQIGYRGCF